MAEFHSLKVIEVYKETPDCAVIAFEVPEHLKKQFQYKQGQHLTIKKQLNGEDIRRNYSLCTSPLQGEWKVAVKAIRDGKFSNYVLNQLQIGDHLEVMVPHGNFTVEVEADAQKNYIAFAAGSGITPLMSIIRTHLELEPQSTFKLFYLNSTVKSIIFKEQIEQLKNQYFERFQVFYFLTREHRDISFLNGRFDQEKMALLTENFIDVPDTDHAFLCGPKEMIFLVRDALREAGMTADKIHYELFFTGASEAEDQQISQILDQQVSGTSLTIIDGGKEFHFIMNEDYDNILDGALAAGADLPYACKGGVCSTCKCQVVEGTVQMKKNYALADKEVAQNYVLSCQAVPTSNKVVVNFDV